MHLSIIIPSINPDRWKNIFNQVKNSVGSYSFDVICSGPNLPFGLEEETRNGSFKYVEDYGCPSRSFQMAVENSKAEYISFIPDDCALDEGALNEALSFMEGKPKNHGMILMYDEGPGNQSKNRDYWTSGFHAPDLDQNGINPNWLIAPCFMYNREYFVEVGGLDCSYEHVNMNGHGLAYFTQANGGQLHYSPRRIFKCSHEPKTYENVLLQAHLKNDRPKFIEFWSQQDAVQKYNVKFNNWKDQEEKWSRRYGQS